MKICQSIVIFALLVLSGWASASPVGDCAGTPADAVVELPPPLDKWGQIACTPYGHIITNRDGWIWSYPAAYAPVFVPSQMVRDDPKELGNKSYFSRIDMTKVDGAELDAAYSVFQEGFDKDERTPTGYRLDVTSNFGKSLKLYFFDYGDSAWGIWCRDKCDPSSRFMLLNMEVRPNKSLQRDAPQAVGQ